MKRTVLISMFVFVVLFSGCECFVDSISYYFVDFKNESNETVMAVAGLIKEGKKVYTTTEFPIDDSEIKTFKPTLPGSSYESLVLKKYLSMDFSKSDSISIFVISPEVYANNEWSEIGKKKLFLKHYKFHLNEIPFPYPINYPNDYD